MASGTYRARTAEDVAQMETDIAYLREENQRLVHEVAVLQAERSRLQVENTMLQGRSMENMRKATRVEAILDNICHGLVASLKEIREERQIDREVRRQAQVEVMERDTGQPPEFLRQPTPARQSLSDQARTEQLRGAAEHVASTPPPPRAGRVDNSKADRDTRLPVVSIMTPQQEDEENLRQLAARIQPRGK
jgi:hypothetical protein